MNTRDVEGDCNNSSKSLNIYFRRNSNFFSIMAIELYIERTIFIDDFV
ncbi:MAG: hypothetical protein R2730_00915 [Chitinophagales bacterium]